MMVQSKMCLSILSALAAVAVVGGQSTSTASLFEAIFDSIALSGEVEGVGADGTTYVLSATYVDEEDVTTIALPVTVTLVEDATHVSEVVAVDITGLPTELGIGAGAFSVNAECDIANGEAVCTEHAVQGTLLSTDNVETLSATLGPVPVVVAAGAATASQTATTSGVTSPSATNSGALSGQIAAKTLMGCITVGAVFVMFL